MTSTPATITLDPARWLMHMATIAAQSPDGDVINVFSAAQKELLERALVRMGRKPDCLEIHVIIEEEIQ